MTLGSLFRPSCSGSRLLRATGVLVLALAPLVPGSLASAAPVAPVHTEVLTTSSRTLQGPNGLSVTATPDPATAKAGDRIHLAFSGMTKNVLLGWYGMCPTLADGRTPAGDPQNVCNGQWDTGLGGPVDASGQSTALSSKLVGFPLYGRKDNTLPLDFIVGQGMVDASNPVVLPSGQDKTALCDTTHACTIGFGIYEYNAQNPLWIDTSSFAVKPAKRDLASANGCGKFDATTITASGAERAQTELSKWNTGFCAGGGGPLPVNLLGQGEGDGLTALGDTTNLAFAGSGLLGSPSAPAATVPRVLTPVALNAVVLAQIGGIEVPSNTTQEYGPTYPSGAPATVPSLALTQADVADILLHNYDYGSSTKVSSLATNLKANNAALQNFAAGSLPQHQAATVVYPVGADSTPISLSNQLQHAAQANLVYPAQAQNQRAGQSRAGTAVAPFTNFSTVVDADGQLTKQVSNAGGIYNAVFGKDVASTAGAQPCPTQSLTDYADQRSCVRFVVTDLVTAQSLGLTVASIQNKSGSFVQPSATSLAAAVAAGTVDDKHLFTPNLDAGGGAYPLPIVEYAVTPATPLLDPETCAPKTAEQKRLAEIVSYYPAAGQRALAAGLAPLPDSLLAVAKTSVAQIGATASTGKCAPAAVAKPAEPATAAATGDAPTGTTLDAGTSSGIGSGSAGSTTAAGGTAGGSTPPPSAAVTQQAAATGPQDVKTAAEAFAIPTFGRAGGIGAFAPLGGIVAVIALMSLAGLVTSGRAALPTRQALKTTLRKIFAPPTDLAGQR